MIVTLGERGCMYYTDGGFHYFPVDTVKVFDLSGAGDTFLAALVWEYLQSNDIYQSISSILHPENFIVNVELLIIISSLLDSSDVVTEFKEDGSIHIQNKKGYGRYIMSHRLITIVLLTGIVLGYILGHLIPVR